ncbi:MAG: alpha/beta fold hydrolase [Acidimicrobiales bacterium]|nr:alpha/beta fold hydrolase [Acidimicrobiales bacterium]
MGPDPPLPPGRLIDLAGRGQTFVRELPGPPGAATVVLLHGWTATADVTWFPSYQALGERFRVLSMDLRGHGRGVPAGPLFRLADCADDVAALARAAGTDRVIVAGYSMGGSVALLVWRRHPELVDGLVLCATSARFTRGDAIDRLFSAGLLGLSLAIRLAPDGLSRGTAAAMTEQRLAGVPRAGWVAAELSSNDPAAMVQAGAALRSFDAGPFLGAIDVPVAVVVTTEDEVVPPGRQRALADAIPGSSVHPVGGGHGACVEGAARFVPVLVDACASVAGRARETAP